ncbi:MAG: hypothetical protein P8O78_03120 [Flavobacteriaceae bacterium]|nr:hypothetical protein [Flavobacteriaceae bacterium]
MKKLLLLSIALFSLGLSAQDKKITIPDLKAQFDLLNENEAGEIDPINDKEINKKVKFFIEEKFLNVEYTRNIIWDSYETFLSPFDRYHYHTYIVQVKVEDVDRLKYIEVKYNPNTDAIESNFEWNADIEDFEEAKVEKEAAAINA